MAWPGIRATAEALLAVYGGTTKGWIGQSQASGPREIFPHRCEKFRRCTCDRRPISPKNAAGLYPIGWRASIPASSDTMRRHASCHVFH